MDISKINGNYVNNTIDNAKSTATDNGFEAQLKSALDSKSDKDLKKVCNDFEGILLNMLYKEMKSSIPQSDLIPSDSGKDIFESMLDDKLMEEASQSNGIGLGDMLYKQMSKQLKNVYTTDSKDNKGDATVVEDK